LAPSIELCESCRNPARTGILHMLDLPSTPAQARLRGLRRTPFPRISTHQPASFLGGPLAIPRASNSFRQLPLAVRGLRALLRRRYVHSRVGRGYGVQYPRSSVHMARMVSPTILPHSIPPISPVPPSYDDNVQRMGSDHGNREMHYRFRAPAWPPLPIIVLVSIINIYKKVVKRRTAPSAPRGSPSPPPPSSSIRMPNAMPCGRPRRPRRPVRRAALRA